MGKKNILIFTIILTIFSCLTLPILTKENSEDKMLDLRPVKYPEEMIKSFLAIEGMFLRDTHVWGCPYTNPKWYTKIQNEFTDTAYFKEDLFLIPVSSESLGKYLLLMYAESVLGTNGIRTQSNSEMIWNSTEVLTDSFETLPTYASGVVNITKPLGGIKHKIKESSVTGFSFIDAAHAHFLNYEDSLINHVAIVYSFTENTINIGGDCGLIVTNDEKLYQWIIQEITQNNGQKYKSFTSKVSIPTAIKMMYGFNDVFARDWFLEKRKKVCNIYSEICDQNGVEYLNKSQECNGFKFIITDPRIVNLGDLTTSTIETVKTHHVCPATYPQLLDSESELREIFTNTIKSQIVGEIIITGE